MIRYLCRTSSQAVVLETDPATAQQVRAVLEPFIRLTPLLGTGLAYWRVGVAGRIRPAGAEVVITSESEPLTRLWCDGERRELLFDPSMPAAFVRQNLCRFIRILLRLLHAADPEVFLHAGLVARDGHGALLMGPKRSGKTSTVMSALRAGYHFVGNDDVSLLARGDGWIGRGWPRRVSVRGDSFAAVGLPGDTSRLVRPAQLRELTGGPELLAEAPVTALVFPRFDPAAPGVVPLPPEESLARLQANELPSPVKHADFLTPWFPAAPTAVRTELLARTAEDVPGFELRQDFAALDPAALTRLLTGSRSWC